MKKLIVSMNIISALFLILIFNIPVRKFYWDPDPDTVHIVNENALTAVIYFALIGLLVSSFLFIYLMYAYKNSKEKFIRFNLIFNIICIIGYSFLFLHSFQLTKNEESSIKWNSDTLTSVQKFIHHGVGAKRDAGESHLDVICRDEINECVSYLLSKGANSYSKENIRLNSGSSTQRRNWHG